jgi:hypothetical protein
VNCSRRRASKVRIEDKKLKISISLLRDPDHPAIKRRQFFLSNPCLCLRNKKAKAVCSRPVIPYSIVLYKVREAFKTKGVASIVILLGGLGCTL